MKKNLFFLLFIALGALVTLPSCGSDDPCKDVDCGANGTCFDGDGTCVCNVGYEGASCTDEWTLKFTGSYNGSQTTAGTIYDLVDPVVVTKVDATTLKFTNFLGLGNTSVLNAIVSLENASDVSAQKFSITSQTDGLGNTVSGSGKISSGKLSGTFTLTQGGTSFDFTIDYTKI